MLPKISRIKKKKDFEIIFKNSKSLKTNLFIFRISKNSLGINRVGFVVSQKVSKKATVRNKVRRRLAEAIKFELGDIRVGTDLVIIALSGIEKYKFSEVKDEINRALQKAALVKKK